MLHINVKTLTTLANKVESGEITTKDLDAYRKLSSKVEEKVRDYNFTGKSDSLSFTLQEAFRAVVYQTKLMAEEPVMYNGKIVPSATLEDTSDIPLIFSRPVLFEDLKVFSGNAHPKLAEDICSYLGIDRGSCEVFKFSNDNTFVQFQENVRERDVFIVQPTCFPVNDPVLKAQVIEQGLHYYLRDNRRAWVLQPDGIYLRAQPQDGEETFIAQQTLLETLGGS